jgi:hypothetical protein
MVEAAAALAVFGLPVEHFLTTRDQDERLVLAAISVRAARLVRELQEQQATLIANAFVRAKLHG